MKKVSLISRTVCVWGGGGGGGGGQFEIFC